METVTVKEHTSTWMKCFSRNTNRIRVYEDAVDIETENSILCFDSSSRISRFFRKDLSTVMVQYSNNIYLKLIVVVMYITTIFLFILGIALGDIEIILYGLGLGIVFFLQIIHRLHFKKDLAKIIIGVSENKIEYSLTLSDDDARIIQETLIPMRSEENV